jgi:hypothetical protein
VFAPLVLVVETMLRTLPAVIVASGEIARAIVLAAANWQYPVAARRLNPVVRVVASEAKV